MSSGRDLQKRIRHLKKRWAEEKREKTEQALKTVMWRVRMWLNCVRRKRAKRLVVRFFADFGMQRLAFVVEKFRSNVVHLQRIIREFQTCTRGRIYILRMYFDKFEQENMPQILAEKMASRKKDKYRRIGDWDTVEFDVRSSKIPFVAENINLRTEQMRVVHHTFERALVRSKDLEKNEQEKKEMRRRHLYKVHPSLRKKLEDSLEPDPIEVDDRMKDRALRDYLTQRRKDHVHHLQKLYIEKQQQTAHNLEDAQELLAKDKKSLLKEMKSKSAAKTSKAILWEPMLLLTGPGSAELASLVKQCVRKASAEYDRKFEEQSAELRRQREESERAEALASPKKQNSFTSPLSDGYRPGTSPASLGAAAESSGEPHLPGMARHGSEPDTISPLLDSMHPGLARGMSLPI